MGKRKASFEENLAQLEKIIEDLESGNLTLEEALERYESGVLCNTSQLRIHTAQAGERAVKVKICRVNEFQRDHP